MAQTIQVAQVVVEVLVPTSGAAPPLTLTCGVPPNGQVLIPYLHAFPVSGGTPPYTFAIIAGGLPIGLVLNAATGFVSGVPLYPPGLYAFTIQVTDSLGATASVACSITIAAGQGPFVSSGGGPAQVRQNCTRNNKWDLCIEDEIRRIRKITFPPMCTIPCEYRNLLPWDDTFGAIPPQAIPFNVAGSILTPLPAAGDQIVCQARVNAGYDGIITGLYQTYTGTGFDNGNGDILWRVQINQRWVKELGNSLFALGNSKQPIPLTEGQLLLAGQTFRFWVNVPNTSGSIQVGNSRITCGMLGFYWPR